VITKKRLLTLGLGSIPLYGLLSWIFINSVDYEGFSLAETSGKILLLSLSSLSGLLFLGAVIFPFTKKAQTENESSLLFEFGLLDSCHFAGFLVSVFFRQPLWILPFSLLSLAGYLFLSKSFPSNGS
jgi:hypothetical protein